MVLTDTITAQTADKARTPWDTEASICAHIGALLHSQLIGCCKHMDHRRSALSPISGISWQMIPFRRPVIGTQ